MINREDMLEITRRMTAARTNLVRLAGAYIDQEGYIDGTFNTNFLNLKGAERNRCLDIAKTIPFAKTNEELADWMQTLAEKLTSAAECLTDCEDNSTMEVDFVVQTNRGITPTEVKAEVSVRAKSLRNFITEDFASCHLKGLRASMLPYKEQDWMINIPLYTVEAFFANQGLGTEDVD